MPSQRPPRAGGKRAGCAWGSHRTRLPCNLGRDDRVDRPLVVSSDRMRCRAHLIRARRSGSSRRPMCVHAIAASMLDMDSPPPHDSPAIETRGLGKTFGSRAALEHVDLVVPRGVAFGFLGANGAGKTTL